MAEDRVAQALRVARELLETEGEAALSMRRLAEGMGIRAPSSYKHVPDKAALEVVLVADGLRELGAAGAAAGPGLAELMGAYRAWALAHPHLYALMTERPLPRERLPPGLEDAAAAPLLAAVGDEHRARALWAAAHGLVALELRDRFPPGSDLDAAWAALVAAFSRAPTLRDVSDEIERTILGLLAARDPGKTICPSEAARALWGDDGFGPHMDEVRAVAFALADRGVLDVTQRGDVVDGRTARGPIRLRTASG